MDGVREKRIADLKAKLKARTKKPGFEKNCEMIQAEIEREEARMKASE